MPHLKFLLLFFLILELLSIVFMVKLIGGIATLILIILSFALGLFILKRTAGLSSMMMLIAQLQTKGNLSFYQLLWPIRIPIASFLFMLPGFLSTLFALILLLPLKGKNWQHSQYTHFSQFSGFTRSSQYDDDIIEGEYVVKEQTKSSSSTKDAIEHKK